MFYYYYYYYYYYYLAISSLNLAFQFIISRGRTTKPDLSPQEHVEVEGEQKHAANVGSLEEDTNALHDETVLNCFLCICCRSK